MQNKAQRTHDHRKHLHITVLHFAVTMWSSVESYDSLYNSTYTRMLGPIRLAHYNRRSIRSTHIEVF